MATATNFASVWVARQLQPLLAKEYGVGRFWRVSKDDCIRLLNWRSWALRYSVGLDWIVRKIMQYYAKVRRPGQGLGLSIPTITGDKTQQMIEEQVEREFDGAQVEMLRVQLQNAMLRVPVVFKVTAKNVDDYAKAYNSKVGYWRRARLEAKHRFRRPWRSNPW